MPLSAQHTAENVTGDLLAATTKASPALTVGAMSVAGIGLQDWVLIATLGYIVLQAGYLGWKWAREWRGKKVSADV